jgi:UDP-glucose 4-epimerase
MDCNNVAGLKPLMRGTQLVYHCAALAYEGLSVFSPHVVVESIVGASVGVFSAAINEGVERIVHCSSMARYGALTPPFNENMPCIPQDPYGIAKLAAEDILRNLCKVHKTDFVIAVPHNIIGPRQKYDDPFRNVASIMLNMMMQGRQPVIYGNGKQRRCFSFIDDCLSCLMRMGSYPGVVGEIINIGPDENAIEIETLAHILAYSVLGWEPGSLAPVYMPGRPQEVFHALCSSDKAREMLDYKTETTLVHGLCAMRDYITLHGTKPFKYHLPIEINDSALLPRTWKDRIF